jgi:transposase-like protein
MYNKYPEEFKRNTVALIRSGYGGRNIANKLGVSATTIVHWTKDARYLDVLPANPDVLLSQLPCGREPEQSTGMQIVKVGNSDSSISKDRRNQFGVSIRFGKLRMEFRDGISIELLAALVRTLGETGVL